MVGFFVFFTSSNAGRYAFHIMALRQHICDAVALKDIPTVGYAALYDDLRERLKQERYHVAHYFALPDVRSCGST